MGLFHRQIGNIGQVDRPVCQLALALGQLTLFALRFRFQPCLPFGRGLGRRGHRQQIGRQPPVAPHLHRQHQRFAAWVEQLSHIQRLPCLRVQPGPDLETAQPEHLLLVPALETFEVEEAQIAQMLTAGG